MIQEKRDILVMFSYRNHKRGYIEMLFDRLSARSQQYPLQLYRGSLSDIHICVKDNQLSIIDTLTNRDIASFDGIYFELWYKAQQQALAVAQYAKTHKVPFFSKELLRIMPMTKVGEVTCLADKKIPLPDTFISSHRQIKKVFIGKILARIFLLIQTKSEKLSKYLIRDIKKDILDFEYYS